MRFRRCASFLAAMALVGTSLFAISPAQAQTPPKRAGGGDTLDILLNVESSLNEVTTRDFLVSGLFDPVSDLFGATLRPVDDILRSQLEIPAGRGLLITSLGADGPAQAGLRQMMFYSLGNNPWQRPMISPNSSRRPAIRPCRSGSRGQDRDDSGETHLPGDARPHRKPQTEYFIGISLRPVEDALARPARLASQAKRGCHYRSNRDSPAERAGALRRNMMWHSNWLVNVSSVRRRFQVQENHETLTTRSCSGPASPDRSDRWRLRRVQSGSTPTCHFAVIVYSRSWLTARERHCQQG